MTLSAIASQRVALVARHHWQTPFALAIDGVARQGVASLSHIRNFDDCLAFVDDLVHWAPRECGDSRLVHDPLVAVYFILDQPPLLALQSPIQPSAGRPALAPLSQRMVRFAQSWGAFLDTPASARHVATFRTNPAFRWHDYMPPPSGYLTFNQFFARHVKPGCRPVAAADDARVLVAPADAVHRGVWPIAADSTVDLKEIRWSVAQLLADSALAGRFAGGVFTHGALRRGYFQFGGSDFVMLFDAQCQATLTCDVDSHHLQGSAIGHCAQAG